jgi:hypothetical protein
VFRWDLLSSNHSIRTNRTPPRKHEKVAGDAMICAYEDSCGFFKEFGDEYCGRIRCNGYEDRRLRGIAQLSGGGFNSVKLPSVEKVARTVHAHWMQTRLDRGLVRCLAEDGEDLLVPYDKLSERQKEKDREIVRAVYAAIQEEA